MSADILARARAWIHARIDAGDIVNATVESTDLLAALLTEVAEEARREEREAILGFCEEFESAILGFCEEFESSGPNRTWAEGVREVAKYVGERHEASHATVRLYRVTVRPKGRP